MAIVDKSSRHKKRFPVRPNFAFNSHLKKICSPSLLVCQWCFCCRIPSVVVVVVVLCSVMEPHPRRAVSSRLGRKAIHAETRRQYKKSSHGNLHHLTTHTHSSLYHLACLLPPLVCHRNLRHNMRPTDRHWSEEVSLWLESINGTSWSHYYISGVKWPWSVAEEGWEYNLLAIWKCERANHNRQ